MGLILNADDYGKSKEVNRAIRECFQKGCIDRTTLMVNMPDAAEAVEDARREGFADRIGIHLNLTEGMPLTEEIRSNPLFCDTEGKFHAAFRQRTVNRLYMDKTSLKQVYAELNAQIRQYAAFDLTLFHIDSHHHIHTDFPIYSVLKKLAQEYRFSSVRLSRNLYHGGSSVNRLYKAWYNRSVGRICETTTDLFGSFLDLRHYGPEENNMGLCRDRQVEIMLHPMYDENGTLMDTDTPMEEVFAYIKGLIG